MVCTFWQNSNQPNKQKSAPWQTTSERNEQVSEDMFYNKNHQNPTVLATIKRNKSFSQIHTHTKWTSKNIFIVPLPDMQVLSQASLLSNLLWQEFFFVQSHFCHLSYKTVERQIKLPWFLFCQREKKITWQFFCKWIFKWLFSRRKKTGRCSISSLCLFVRTIVDKLIERTIVILALNCGYRHFVHFSVAENHLVSNHARCDNVDVT